MEKAVTSIEEQFCLLKNNFWLKIIFLRWSFHLFLQASAQAFKVHEAYGFHMSVKLWKVFFSLLSQNPDWHQTASFKSLCLTAQPALLRQPTPPVVSLNLKPERIREGNKKTIWNKTDPSCSVYNHTHFFNHLKKSTKQWNIGQLFSQSTLGRCAPMCFLQAKVTETLEKSILFQTYKNPWNRTHFGGFMRGELLYSHVQNKSHSWDK